MQVNCTDVNVHFYRNFDTPEGATNVQQDLLLTLAKAGTQRKIFGFFGDYTSEARTSNGTKAWFVGPTKTDFVAVYPKYKEALESASSEDGAASFAAYSSFIATFCYMMFF